jgi:hypothetical protein
VRKHRDEPAQSEWQGSIDGATGDNALEHDAAYSRRSNGVDRTGLTGNFDLQLEWIADPGTPGFWAPDLRPLESQSFEIIIAPFALAAVTEAAFRE